MRPDDLLDRFEIDPTATECPLAPQHEPVLTSEPAPPGFVDDAPLDPKRATAEPEKPPPAPRQRTLPFGLVGSLAIHLLPLLVLLRWTSAPAEIAVPIPVQLVIVKPPPALPPRPKSEIRKPPGRLASIDIGEPAASADRPAGAKPNPPRELVSALPTPAPPPTPAILPPRPEQAPEVDRPMRQAVAAGHMPKPHPAPRPAPHPGRHPAPHPGRIPGPAATRDEYLAYCAALIRRSYGMLPASLIAGRSGRTVLSLVVLDNGSITHIAVTQSSGYRDIDSRIEQMVAAVRRFPPLPQWIQARSIALEYIQVFPDAPVGR